MIVFDPNKILYVFQLPAKTVSELATALDPGGCWEVIAYLMPGIQDIDIERLNTAADGHPTETLLRIWGSKGYKILDLYKVFYRAKLLFCMQILLPFVDNQFHKYAQMCADGTTQPSQKQNSPSSIRSANLRKAVVHQSVTKKSSLGVYSRRGLSSADPSAGSSAGGVPEAAQGINASTSTAAEQNGAILSGLQNTLSVKYDDILAATGGFNAKNILGRGGYGVVYRGVWKHQEVAVKRIQGKREGGGDEKQQKERLRQSLQELRTLAKFRHDNILSIYGYSLDGLEPCLIYQFMSNGSLEDRLLCKSGSLPLNWSTRLEISKGVSCGLHFLHSITNMPIIHGDVKSANILLDKHFNPKLGDFGLSRDGQIEVDGDKRPMIASHVKGTLAYLPPEFTTSRILTTKLDVYSFGVVLLELGTGQRAFASSRDPPGLVEYVLKHSGVKKGNMDQNFDDSTVELLADRRAPNLSDENAGRLIFKRLISLGVTCTQNDRFLRPTFSEVFAQIVNLT